MGVGERSEALPNIKAMREKMLCPPREPGLHPPHPPTPAFPPLLNPTSIKDPALGPRLPSEAVAASGGSTAAGTKTAGARGPGSGWLPTPLNLTLPGSLTPLWVVRSKAKESFGEMERVEPTGGKTRGQNLQNLKCRGVWLCFICQEL